MSIRALFALVLGLALPSFAAARPAPEKITPYTDSGLPSRGLRTPGVLATAAAPVYFGGTVWAADSMRWEALPDSAWTFDTGVGSHFNHADPFVDPFKANTLHAYMEGWIGIDGVAWARDESAFRRLQESDFTGDVCVGATGGLGGSWSFWAGMLQEEAEALCWAGGQGYGWNWDIAIEKTVSYPGTGSVTLDYDYTHDVEPAFDYVYVEVISSAGTATALTYNGVGAGHETLVLQSGVELPAAAEDVTLRFRVTSDGGYSDVDGLYATLCGAFAVDNVALTGAITDGPATFETSEDGWALSLPPQSLGGDWSDIRDLTDLPPMMTPCECAVTDSVLLFEDFTAGGHNLFQDNIAASPWIDLRAAGMDGAPVKFLTTDFYAEMPLLNYVFAQFQSQWYPDVCETSGKLVTSPFTSNGFVYYFGGVPACSHPSRSRSGGWGGGSQAFGGIDDGRMVIDFSAVVPVGAEQMRIGMGVISYCRFFGNCTGITNPTPYFDNVSLGVYGSPDAPILVAEDQALLPQDAWPTLTDLALNRPARIDCNEIKGDNDQVAGTSLGDTLVIAGGQDGAEVRVQFAVRPGPALAGSPALAAWLTQHQHEGSWRGLQWYSARIDTAEIGGTVQAGEWMTTYHELDPNFTGSDTDPDPTDPSPVGLSRLANDVFPDDLLTPGSRLYLFFKARYDGSGRPATGVWFTEPDTAGGTTFEMEVFPASAEADSTWNCVLYVDRANRDAQPVIESALASVMPGTSANAEGTTWDRFDVRNPFAYGNASLGRGFGTSYGASWQQLGAYRTILWSTGEEGTYGMFDADAENLIVWMDQATEGRNLYLTGNALAHAIDGNQTQYPDAHRLLTEYAGTSYSCYVIRNADCPGVPSLTDSTSCLPVDPVGGHFAGNDGDVVVTGNACPEQRQYSLIDVSPAANGVALGNERYQSPVKGALDFASVSHEVDAGVQYRTVTEGASVHWRARESDCTDPGAVADRLTRVLGWFGYGGGPAVCAMPSPVVTGVPGERGSGLRTGLLGVHPNPLVPRSGGVIRFELAERGRARIEVFDVAGRRVRTLVDAVVDAGGHEARWDARDSRGAAVPSGVYFYRLVTDGFEASRKMVVVAG